MSENLYYVIRIWVSLLARPVLKTEQILIDTYGSIEDAWNASVNNDNIFNYDNVLYNRFNDIKLREKAFEIYNDCINKNIKICSIHCKNYPANLLNIDNKPYVLYYKGVLPYDNNIDDNNLLAVVGSRRCTSYGRSISYKFSKSLAECGVGIVSGMARGIDAEAHKGALSADCYTVAVLGSGIDIIYPKEHSDLYYKIIEKGCVLSEYPPKSPVYKNNFPARNRIISGLSRGVLVVEATDKSGAMITVDTANTQGRIVMAIPGNINSDNSSGCNMLIRQGVTLISSYGDVLDELNIKYDLSKNMYTWLNGLTGVEKDVAMAIIAGNYHPDEICNYTRRNTGSVLSALTMLEIKCIVTKGFDGAYKIIL